MKIIAEYIWLDHQNNFRSKTKIFDIDNDDTPWFKLSTYPKWNYDGSSTGDIPENNEHQTECFLYPIAIYKDPFYNTKLECDTYKNILVLCNNSYILNNQEIGVHPIMFNNLTDISQELDNHEYRFGFEQEFFMINPETNLPPSVKDYRIIKQGQYYCSTGVGNAFQRDFLNDTQTKLLDAGIQLTGFNYEVAPGQAEFQVSDYGIEALFQLIMLRYILQRNGEDYNLIISFDNVLHSGDNINNTGCHTNISTNKTRSKEMGMKYITDILKDLEERVITDEEKFNKVFGKGNTERLCGILETSKWNEFSWGMGTRHTSIRIPNEVMKNKCGYLEDRRPGGNMNPFNYVYYLLNL